MVNRLVKNFSGTLFRAAYSYLVKMCNYLTWLKEGCKHRPSSKIKSKSSIIAQTFFCLRQVRGNKKQTKRSTKCNSCNIRYFPFLHGIKSEPILQNESKLGLRREGILQLWGKYRPWNGTLPKTRSWCLFRTPSQDESTSYCRKSVARCLTWKLTFLTVRFLSS